MEPTQHDRITRRLHSLGDQPIDPEVAARHRSLMASVPVASSRSRLRPVMVGSLLAGSLFGGMGLAAAAPGVPDSASNVAKTVLATVTLGAVDHPEDDKGDKGDKADSADTADTADRADDASEVAREAAEKAEEATDGAATNGQDDPAGPHGVARSTTGCPAGFTGNHGEYVSSIEDDPATADVDERQVAAQSECGKPVHPDRPDTPGTDADKPADRGQSEADHGHQGSGKPEAGQQRGQSGGQHGDDAEDEADDDEDDDKNSTNKARSGRPDGARRPSSAGSGHGRPAR